MKNKYKYVSKDKYRLPPYYQSCESCGILKKYGGMHIIEVCHDEERGRCTKCVKNPVYKYMGHEKKKILKKLIRHDYYFNDDTQKRDIYNITIKKNGKSISFEFGNSIYDEGKKPSDYNILSCIKMEYFCPDNFNDFCEEYGYNNDSINALKIFYKSTVLSNKLKTIFTEDEINKLED